MCFTRKKELSGLKTGALCSFTHYVRYKQAKCSSIGNHTFGLGGDSVK